MRLRAVLAVALLLSASSLFAQQSRTEVSVFASDLAYARSASTDSSFSGGVGVRLNEFWTSRISTELGVTMEKHFSFVNEQKTAVYRYPFDAIAQYHFVNDTRWQPYVGAGVRAIDRVTPELNMGVVFQFSSHLNLKFDGRFAHDHATDYNDSLAKFSVGLGWRF